VHHTFVAVRRTLVRPGAAGGCAQLAVVTTRTAAQRAAEARALGPTDLVLSHLTVPRAGFEERVAAAAAAGFAGIGLNLGGYKRLRREGWSLDELAAVRDHHGPLLVEIEFLQAWSGGAGSLERAREEADLAFELAAGLGARHLQLGGMYRGAGSDGSAGPGGADDVEFDLGRAAEAFAAVCDRASAFELRCSIEYLPEMTAIGSAADAAAIVRDAGRANGGICVDSWHHERGPDTLATLAAFDGGLIASVQFDDGHPRPPGLDYQTDTATNRLAPGEGSFDLAALLHTLRGLGVTAPIGLEVISPSLAASGDAATVARRVAEGMRAVLTAAALG